MECHSKGDLEPSTFSPVPFEFVSFHLDMARLPVKIYWAPTHISQISSISTLRTEEQVEPTEGKGWKDEHYF